MSDEPGRAKVPKEQQKGPPKGASVHALGGLKQIPGHQRAEPPTRRAERLRRIARGEKP